MENGSQENTVALNNLSGEKNEGKLGQEGAIPPRSRVKKVPILLSYFQVYGNIA